MMDPGSPSSPDHQHNDKGNHQNHHPEKGAEEEFHHQDSEPSFHGLDTGMSFVRTIEKRIKNFMHRIEDDYEHLQEELVEKNAEHEHLAREVQSLDLTLLELQREKLRMSRELAQLKCNKLRPALMQVPVDRPGCLGIELGTWAEMENTLKKEDMNVLFTQRFIFTQKSRILTQLEEFKKETAASDERSEFGLDALNVRATKIELNKKLEHFYSTRVENLKRITKNQETDIKQEDQTRAKSKPENPDAGDSELDSLASIHPEEELEEGVSEQTSESSTRREGSGENAGSGLVVSYEDTFVNLKLKMVDECKQLEYELMEINDEEEILETLTKERQVILEKLRVQVNVMRNKQKAKKIRLQKHLDNIKSKITN